MTNKHLQSDTHQSEFLIALLMPLYPVPPTVSPSDRSSVSVITQGKRSLVSPFSELPPSLPDNAVSLHLQKISRIGPPSPFPPWDKESIALALSRAGCFNPRHKKSESGHILPLLKPPHGSHSPRSHLIFSFCLQLLPPPSVGSSYMGFVVVPQSFQAQSSLRAFARTMSPAPDVLIYSLMAVTSTSPALFSPEFCKVYS